MVVTREGTQRKRYLKALLESQTLTFHSLKQVSGQGHSQWGKKHTWSQTAREMSEALLNNISIDHISYKCDFQGGREVKCIFPKPLNLQTDTVLSLKSVL